MHMLQYKPADKVSIHIKNDEKYLKIEINLPVHRDVQKVTSSVTTKILLPCFNLGFVEALAP